MTIHTQTRIDLYSLAREALSEAEGNTNDATRLLDRRLTKDKALRLQIIEQAIREATRHAAVTAHHINRAQLVAAVKSGREQVRSLATGMARTILDFPLLDGTKLRDATHDDLSRAITDYSTKSREMAHRASWLTAIMAVTPVQGKVSDTVDDDTALRLWKEAQI